MRQTKCTNCKELRDSHPILSGPATGNYVICGKHIPRKTYVKRKFLVPFDKEGNQLKLPKTYYEKDENGRWKYANVCERKENYIFNDTLKLVETVQDRASVSFKFKSIFSEKTYWMFVKDLTKMLESVTMSYGQVVGSWTFVKKGRHYGIIYNGAPSYSYRGEESQTRHLDAEVDQTSGGHTQGS